MNSADYRTCAICLFVVLAIMFAYIGCRDIGIFKSNTAPIQSSCNAVSAMRAQNAVPSTQTEITDDKDNIEPMSHVNRAFEQIDTSDSSSKCPEMADRWAAFENVTPYDMSERKYYGRNVGQTQGREFSDTKNLGATTSTTYLLHANKLQACHEASDPTKRVDGLRIPVKTKTTGTVTQFGVPESYMDAHRKQM